MPESIQKVEDQQAQTIGAFYTGPVPPPVILEQLERIVPGAAERIIVMAEKEQQATHTLYQNEHSRKERAQKDEHRENMTSLWMAFFVSLTFVGCGTVLVLNGFEKIGCTLIGTTLLGVVASFLRNKNK